MFTNVVPRIAVRQVVLAAPGKLSTGTITPPVAGETAGRVPDRIAFADVWNTAAWSYSDNATVAFPIAANLKTRLDGSFVKDATFAAGTYIICFYLDV